MNKLYVGLVVLLFATGSSLALDRSGAGRTPPMGWNSWNYHGKRRINEQVVIETIDAMVDQGLRDANSLFSRRGSQNGETSQNPRGHDCDTQRQYGSDKAHWKKRAGGQPFLAVLNITVTHESQLSQNPLSGIHSGTMGLFLGVQHTSPGANDTAPVVQALSQYGHGYLADGGLRRAVPVSCHGPNPRHARIPDLASRGG